jgi:ABC-type uncharacterized transport system fused permease/ATPase subunit
MAFKMLYQLVAYCVTKKRPEAVQFRQGELRKLICYAWKTATEWSSSNQEIAQTIISVGLNILFANLIAADGWAALASGESSRFV